MQTDNPLDVALEGDGVFSVKTPQGMRYTRAGNFQLNADKQLVTQDGFQVMGAGGKPITLPPEDREPSRSPPTATSMPTAPPSASSR